MGYSSDRFVRDCRRFREKKRSVCAQGEKSFDKDVSEVGKETKELFQKPEKVATGGVREPWQEERNQELYLMLGGPCSGTKWRAGRRR